MIVTGQWQTVWVESRWVKVEEQLAVSTRLVAASRCSNRTTEFGAYEPGTNCCNHRELRLVLGRRETLSVRYGDWVRRDNWELGTLCNTQVRPLSSSHASGSSASYWGCSRNWFDPLS